MIVVLLVLQPFCEYVQFFSSSELFSFIFSYLAYGTWLMWLLAGHLAIIASLAPRRRRGWSFGIAAVVIGVIVLFEYVDENDFSTGISFSTPLKAYGAEWLPSKSIDDFLAESRQAKKEVDTLADDED